MRSQFALGRVGSGRWSRDRAWSRGDRYTGAQLAALLTGCLPVVQQQAWQMVGILGVAWNQPARFGQRAIEPFGSRALHPAWGALAVPSQKVNGCTRADRRTRSEGRRVSVDPQLLFRSAQAHHEQVDLSLVDAFDDRGVFTVPVLEPEFRGAGACDSDVRITLVDVVSRSVGNTGGGAEQEDA